ARNAEVLPRSRSTRLKTRKKSPQANVHQRVAAPPVLIFTASVAEARAIRSARTRTAQAAPPDIPGMLACDGSETFSSTPTPNATANRPVKTHRTTRAVLILLGIFTSGVTVGAGWFASPYGSPGAPYPEGA